MHSLPHRPRCLAPGRTLALLSASLLLTGVAGAQLGNEPGPTNTIVQVVSEPFEPELEEVSGGTEGDMNCFEIVFARSGLRAIVQNFPDMGEGFTQNQRTLAKWLTREVAFRPGNAIHSYLESGELYGIEFDWFFPGPVGLARPSLPRSVDVHLSARGEEGPFAEVYGFLAGEYAAYKLAVEGMIGHPMESFVVWEPETLCTGAARLTLVGQQNQLQGPLLAGGDVRLAGYGNVVDGPLWVAGLFQRTEGNRTSFVGRCDGVPLPNPGVHLETLRAEARSNGTYFPGDALLATNAPPTGVVFAEGHLTVAASGWSGAWTLVSASGDVELAGDDLALQPGVSTVTAIAFSGSVRVSGDRVRAVGELHAPQGTLDVSGSSNTLLGAFTAGGAIVGGDANLLSDGTRLPDPSTP